MKKITLFNSIKIIKQKSSMMKKYLVCLVVGVMGWQMGYGQMNLQVPKYYQIIPECTNKSHCGPTSVLMACDYLQGIHRNETDVLNKLRDYGDQLTKDGLTHNKKGSIPKCGIAGTGFWYDEILNIAKHYEGCPDSYYGTNLDIDAIKEIVKNGYPIVVNVSKYFSEANKKWQDGTHWIVIRGVDDNYIYINDPFPSVSSGLGNNISVSHKDFFNMYKTIYIVVKPSYSKINSGIEIYAGERNTPRTNVKITIDGTNLPMTNTTPRNFVIGDENYSISTTNYRNDGTTASFEIVQFPSGLTNKLYNFSFEINDINDKPIKFFGKEQLYYIDENAVADVNQVPWSTYYIKKGIRNGLFKGSYEGTAYRFNPTENLKRGAFAKMVVSAAIKLGTLTLNTSTERSNFTDIANSEYQPYILTLLNGDCIQNSSTFRPNDNMTLGEMCKILCNAFKLNNSDINRNQLKKLTERRIVVLTNPKAPDLKEYIERLMDIVNQNEYEANNSTSYESLITNLYNIPEASYPGNDDIPFDGSTGISRAGIAKALWNAYQFKARQLSITLRRAVNNNSLSNVTIIGDKFEATTNITGSTPQIPQQFGNIVLKPGGEKIFDLSGLESNYFCYWTVNGGSLEDLAPYNAHKKVRFVAPQNISSTEVYDLYIYIGSSGGTCAEGFAKITVSQDGTSGNTNQPTVQASNLKCTDKNVSTISLQWTRGNGAGCIVTCTPSSKEYCDPNDGYEYNADSRYSYADYVAVNYPNTRVVYKGTGNNVTVKLTGDTEYLFKVYEYNGNATSTRYLKTSAPQLTVATEAFIILENISNITWETPVIAGVSHRLWGQFTCAQDFLWNIEGADITTSTEISPTVTFQIPGVYHVTFTSGGATNTSTVTKTVTVVDGNKIPPNLSITNVQLSSTNIVKYGYEDLNIKFDVVNRGMERAYPVIQAYVTTDSTKLQNEFIHWTDSHWLEQNKSFSFDESTKSYHTLFPVGKAYIVIVLKTYDNVQNNYPEKKYVIPFTISEYLPNIGLKSGNITPNTAMAGQKVNITATAYNSLASSMITTVYASLYLSRDAIWDEDDVNLGYSLNWLNLENQDKVSNNEIPLPSTLANGQYYIIIKIWGVIYGGDWMEEPINFSPLAIPFTINNQNQPTIPATNIKAENCTVNSMKISWTNGNGNKRIVLMRENNAIERIPVQGEILGANADFNLAPTITNSSGTKTMVVYNGTGNNVTVTGLTENMPYSFMVYEYNDNGSPNYLFGTPEICVFATTGAVNTELIWLPSITKDKGLSLGDIHFVNSNEGYAIAWGLSKTKDGGKNWTLIDIIKHYPNRIQASSNNYSKMIWKNVNEGMIVGGSNIYYTIDGGYTWTTKTKPDLFIYGAQVRDGNIIYVSGVKDNTGVVYKSMDYGNTWTLLGNFASTAFAVHFMDEMNGLVSTGNGGTIYKTTNGGVSWSQVASSPVGIWGMYKHFYFHNSQNGLLLTDDGKLFKTQDGGNSWNTVETYKGSSYVNVAPKIAFVNDKTGFTTSANSILKTEDGGNTWQEIPTDLNTLYVLSATSATDIWVGGKSGIAHSIKGGVSKAIFSPSIDNQLCKSGNSFNVLYDATGQFQANNVFNVELSDKDGNFVNPTVIGQKSSSETTGTISCSLNNTIPVGSLYRVRVVSTNPVLTGTNNGENIVIAEQTIVEILNVASDYRVDMPPVTLDAIPVGGSFEVDGSVITELNPQFLGAGIYTLIYSYNAGGCNITDSRQITIYPSASLKQPEILSGNSFCAGNKIQINPNASGLFDDDNLFKVELSDASGNFSNVTTLDYIFGKNIETSPLSINLPDNLPQGNYKIRLSSSEPSIQGQASNAFTVMASTKPEVTITANKQEICEGASVIFGVNNVQNTGNTRQYQWFVNEQPTGANSPAFSTGSLQDGDIVKMELHCTDGCFTTVLSNEIAINVKSKQTPIVEIFISYLDDPQPGEPVDLFAFAENTGENVTYEWYVNNELQGNNEPFFTVNYYPNTTVKVKVLCNADCLKYHIAEGTYTFDGLTTGIESLKINKANVYPNPTKGIIKIESKEIIQAIELYDLTGKMVLKKQFNQSNPEFSIENYPAGNYLLRITVDNAKVVRKVIKL